MHARRAFALALVLSASGCVGGRIGGIPECDQTPVHGEAKTLDQNERGTVLPNGHLLSPMGVQLGSRLTATSDCAGHAVQVRRGMLGFPVNLVLSPQQTWAYVANQMHAPSPCGAGGTKRGVVAIDYAQGEGTEFLGDFASPPSVDRPLEQSATCAGGSAPFAASNGLAADADGRWVFSATGESGKVYVYRAQGVPDACGSTVAPHPQNDGGEAVPGSLVAAATLHIGGYTSGLAVSGAPCAPVVWVVQLVGERGDAPILSRLELAVDGTGLHELAEKRRSFALMVPSDDNNPASSQVSFVGAYDIAVVSAPALADPSLVSERAFVTGFRAGKLMVVDAASGAVTALDVGKNPEGIVFDEKRKRMYVAVSDDDCVAVVSTENLDQPITCIPIGRDGSEPVSDALEHFPGSSPSSLALNGDASRLYVTRAADNAVSVVTLDGDPHEIGAIPVGHYPTAVRVRGSKVVVANGKGFYGPLCPAAPPVALANQAKAENDSCKLYANAPWCTNQYQSDGMQGWLSVVDEPDSRTLATWTALVRQNLEAPRDDSHAGACFGPVPSAPAAGLDPGSLSPIEHIVLVVRENKTYDFLLGDYTQTPTGEPVNGSPELALDTVRRRLGLRPILPNLHALATSFALFDNFYAESEISMQGHAWLTSSFANDYVERMHLEEQAKVAGIAFDQEPGLPAGISSQGTFFTHLLSHQRSFIDFGEAVGALGHVGDDYVIDHVDLGYPGPFFNLERTDISRVNHIAQGYLGDSPRLPAFTYVLLPRDHTMSSSVGADTPEAMIEDNDYATGLLVDYISHSPVWPTTVIFVVEDDPQQGYDHVDYHRTLCLAVSPWVRRGSVNHTHGSFASLFRTFERILGLPPMNRWDASAPALDGVFNNRPDPAVFSASGQCKDVAKNPDECSVAAELSRRMDFRLPDSAAHLGDVIWSKMTGTPVDPALLQGTDHHDDD